MNEAQSVSAEPVQNTAEEASFSTFDRALQDYIAQLPKEKKKYNFIELCRDSGANATPQAINELLKREEARHAISGPARKIFSMITRVLKEYSDIIGQFVSAQPLPCAIIWGALKVVVEASTRHDSMFDKMRNQLLLLAEYLQRITLHEELYGDSKEMQRLLFVSYTNIIHFWHRVHKECKHKGFAASARALNPSNLQKINSIISEIQTVSRSIIEQAQLCQGQKDKTEYDEARLERKLASEWREKQNVANHFELCNLIRGHLAPSSEVMRPNTRRHEKNLEDLHPETCLWLLEEKQYIKWRYPGPQNCSRIFCLSGRLGCGKSMITSFAIRDLEAKGAAVAYYFCQFSQPCEDPTEILRVFSLQLFNTYFARNLPLDQDFGHRILQSHKPEHFRELISELVSRLLHLGGVYFIVDGLDEGQLSSISPVIQFLSSLLDQWSSHEVGLMVTKRRPSPKAIEWFEKFIEPKSGFSLELRDHTEADVIRYLQVKLESLKQRICSQKGYLSMDEEVILRLAESYLTANSDGNFLWARLMTQDFEGENRVEDAKQLLQKIGQDTPKPLADLYMQAFQRFNRLDKENEQIAVKVMSMVAYARRQLRLEELQAATATLVSHGRRKKAALDATRMISVMPLKVFMERYTILVEIDGDASNPSPTDTCRLIHSSVFEFIHENPAVLNTSSKDHQLNIGLFSVANACLTYLVRPVYSQLLQKQSLPEGNTVVWTDSTGEAVETRTHAFLQYAAKYWVQHVSDLEEKEQDLIRERVISFVSSNNFQTCMQVQSIWVQGRFDQYFAGGHLCLLRSIPDWLIKNRVGSSKRLTVTKYWLAYRSMIYDWRTLLSCGGCHDSNPDCYYLTFRGESERIWWKSFGPNHLFHNFQGRYRSFRLAEVEDAKAEYFEAITISPEEIVTVRLQKWDHAQGSLNFVCEHWTVSAEEDEPSLSKKQIISATEGEINWSTYVKPPLAGQTPAVVSPTALSNDSKILRLGSRIFIKDTSNEYHALPGSNLPEFFEEFDHCRSLIAIGSRSHTVVEEMQDSHDVEGLGKDITHLERLARATNGYAEDWDDDETDDEWMSEDLGSDEPSENEMEQYESWSEGSTDEEDEDSSDSESPDTEDTDTEEEEEEEDSDKSDVTSESASSQPDTNKDTKLENKEDSDAEDDSSSEVMSTGSLPPFSRFQDDASEDEEWGIEVDAHLGVQSHGFLEAAQGLREPTVLLSVFQQHENSPPTRVFTYSYPLRFMLYNSPPAIHPRESLVVWALGGGHLLFADIAKNTYFTRQLRPSAPHSRQITVKLRFSPCGNFLHVASLEVRLVYKKVEGSRHCKKDDCPIHRPPPEIHLYLLLLTYRLSREKPTRCPPALSHRVKISFGEHEGPLNLSQLPFVFTWTPHDLFVSKRGRNLNVFRVQLFRSEIGSNPSDGCEAKGTRHNVLVPAKQILLPDSAAFRDVHFVPLSSNSDNPACMIVVASETRGKNNTLMENGQELLTVDSTPEDYVEQKRRLLSLPIGAILSSDDIGGWITPQEGVVEPQDRSMGYLNMRKEKFDPIFDCDAEPY